MTQKYLHLQKKSTIKVKKSFLVKLGYYKDYNFLVYISCCIPGIY